MRILFLIWLIMYCSTAMSSNRDEIKLLLEKFYEGYASGVPSEVLARHFVNRPIFYIGEMPAISGEHKITEKMIDVYRAALGLEKDPFIDMEIIGIYSSEDGSALASALFLRESSPAHQKKNFCHIFSLAKLSGEWKFNGLFIMPPQGPTKCA